MKIAVRTWSALALILVLFCGCTQQNPKSTQPITEAVEYEPTTSVMPPEEVTVVTTEPTSASTHSELYIPGVSVENVILYFNEVCLDAEIINSGCPTKLQRWEEPIRYICKGFPTEVDRQKMDSLVGWLNIVEGFPGMWETLDYENANLTIYFCEEEEYLAIMGDDFIDTDGSVTFWYNDADEIYDAVIGYRSDIDQQIRNSVIYEEIYNGLGPINDTELRSDSIIYAEYSTPQNLSEIDKLIIQLLYHPQMKCGMDADACEEVIRQLYY